MVQLETTKSQNTKYIYITYILVSWSTILSVVLVVNGSLSVVMLYIHSPTFHRYLIVLWYLYEGEREKYDFFFAVTYVRHCRN